jgi:hypothetical protein
MVLSTSIDGFSASTPLEVLQDGRDAMLAIGMNGEPLPWSTATLCEWWFRGCTGSSPPPSGWWTWR